MNDTKKTVLSIKEFPADLMLSLKMQALKNQTTLRDYVISNLQQIVDNGNNAITAKRKS
jgi:hypothetical protein